LPAAAGLVLQDQGEELQVAELLALGLLQTLLQGGEHAAELESFQSAFQLVSPHLSHLPVVSSMKAAVPRR
jgi:hypothetical protein